MAIVTDPKAAAVAIDELDSFSLDDLVEKPGRGRPTKEQVIAKEEAADPPRYELLQPFYAPGDRYIAADEIIIWRGTPNESMRPLNPAAQRRWDTWYDNLPSKPRPLDQVVADAIANRPKYDATTSQQSVSRPERPSRVMGRQAEVAEEVEVVTRSQDRVKPQRKQMGTVIQETPVPGSI